MKAGRLQNLGMFAAGWPLFGMFTRTFPDVAEGGVCSATGRLSFYLLSRLCVVFLFLLLVFWPFSAWAIDSYFTDDQAPIARHDVRSSAEKLPRNKRELRLGLLFTSPYPKPDAELNSQYLELPRCAKPDVKLLAVYQHNPATEAFDVVYFDPQDPIQVAAAKNYPKRSVAYQPALVRDAKTGQTDIWQFFARMMRIECLPTRFHFIMVGNQRFMEFRSGALAWSVGAEEKEKTKRQ